MSIQNLKQKLPDFARDLRLNLSAIEQDSELSARQRWGIALASAVASRNPDVVDAVDGSAGDTLDSASREAARSAAAIMSMNNVYYRFLHMVENDEYQSMPARLRMQVVAKPGVDKLDFELYALAVSAINGCASCVDSHEKALRTHGASAAMVHDTVRIAAIVHAVAATLATGSLHRDSHEQTEAAA